MFTLSSINAILNALVIAIFMPDEVIVLYGFDGSAFMYGSRWIYLIPLAIPLIISGSFLLAEKLSDNKNQKNSVGSKKTYDDEVDVDTTNAIDEILTGNTLHSDNLSMVFTWFFAILSWVLTGIALNNIENVSIIMPSIIVVMLSAVVIFLASLHSNTSENSICGIKLEWLESSEEVRRKSGKLSMYMGVLSGMLGVCLAAWSLVISNNIPNFIAILIILVFALILPIGYSYAIYKKSNK